MRHQSETKLEPARTPLLVDRRGRSLAWPLRYEPETAEPHTPPLPVIVAPTARAEA